MTVELDYKEYLHLLASQERLETLKCNGVDNWDNYGCNCEYTGEDECIFCTEDELAFVEKYAKPPKED